MSCKSMDRHTHIMTTATNMSSIAKCHAHAPELERGINSFWT